MNHYEAMYIIDAMVEEQPRKDLIERFSNLIVQNGGTVERVDEWGKRTLAYPINYKTVGYYVLMYFTAPSAMPRELERNFQISESVLRYLVVANDGKLPPKREVRPAAPTAQTAAPVITIADTATDEMVVTSEEPKAEEAAPVEE
ncbi:MAG: 30S ribosomal protein S6 [Candidatus Fimadaptatus sp.]|jgi:small subunit ribosomal protein S6